MATRTLAQSYHSEVMPIAFTHISLAKANQIPLPYFRKAREI